MKYFVLVVTVIFGIGIATYGVASTPADHTHTASSETVIEHGGGCRKSSPTGMCCHAGSQPYHCH